MQRIGRFLQKSSLLRPTTPTSAWLPSPLIATSPAVAPTSPGSGGGGGPVSWLPFGHGPQPVCVTQYCWPCSWAPISSPPPSRRPTRTCVVVAANCTTSASRSNRTTLLEWSGVGSVQLEPFAIVSRSGWILYEPTAGPGTPLPDVSQSAPIPVSRAKLGASVSR